MFILPNIYFTNLYSTLNTSLWYDKPIHHSDALPVRAFKTHSDGRLDSLWVQMLYNCHQIDAEGGILGSDIIFDKHSEKIQRPFCLDLICIFINKGGTKQMHTFVKTGQRSCLLYSSNVMILLVSHFTYLKSEFLHKQAQKLVQVDSLDLSL